MLTISLEQARRFILLKNGLIGPKRFSNKAGVLSYVRQAGCVQFDPLDVCGRNADLVFQSRVLNYDKAMLSSLLYEDRTLLDYWDKNMAIIPAEQWPNLARFRRYFLQAKLSNENLEMHWEEYRNILHERGSVSATDLKSKPAIHWYWNASSLARVVLETLFYRCEAIIHHRKGAIKYYGLASDWLPSALLEKPDIVEDDFQYRKRRILQRIGAVGLLWNRASAAFLMVSGWYEPIRQSTREACFDALMAERLITEVHVEGIAYPFYYVSEDEPMMIVARSEIKLLARTELIAPLDGLLWDRRLVMALFGFDYTWEVYVPESKRQYGYYVLPLLDGTELVGRVEIVRDKTKKVLVVKHVWLEAGHKYSAMLKKRFEACLVRFARFNDCLTYEIATDAIVLFQQPKPKG